MIAYLRIARLPFFLLLLVTSAPPLFAAPPTLPTPGWRTVVNNNDVIPGTVTANNPSGRKFNSYSQPSVNASGAVVFRARGKGGSGSEPPHGVYLRQMAVGGGILKILDKSSQVPAPNDLGSTYIETPSFPRIDIGSANVVTRGNHQPTVKYLLPDGTETRSGTSGIYSYLGGALVTAAAKLGAVGAYSLFSVPGAAQPLSFEVFPGAPAITDGSTIVFKGNYSVGTVSKTGVYFRDLQSRPYGGNGAVQCIADSNSKIPGTEVNFGSTAPPSAAGRKAVFTGWDNEESPNLGGIYLADLDPLPAPAVERALSPLVSIGARVPGGSPGEKFTQLGEALAFDGRYVAFWGAWGDRTKTVRLYCPKEGNKDRIAYCNHSGAFYGAGDPASICTDAVGNNGRCYQEKRVPVDQGIFLHDNHTGRTWAVAVSGEEYDDFLFWTYSGKVPGGTSGGEGGEDDAEPVRWRASSFAAVSGSARCAVFKARKADGVTGLYLGLTPGLQFALLDSQTDGRSVDPAAPMGSKITEVGLERDGLRNGWLAVTARMGVEGGSEEEGMAGVYLMQIPVQAVIGYWQRQLQMPEDAPVVDRPINMQ